MSDRAGFQPGNNLWPVAAVVAAAVIPFVVSDYRVFQITMVLVYAIALLGLNLLTGYSGQVSLGHGAFFALGAYCAAILIEHAEIGPALAVPIAGIVGLAAGVAFARPALRLEGLYLALATFALAVTTPQVLRERHLAPWTGGVQGIIIRKSGVPFGLPVDPERWLYLVVLATAIGAFVLARNLTRGRTGRALVAIRDHQVAASTIGIDPAHFKTLVFGLSAAYAAVAGSLSAIVVQFVAPDSFPFILSITFLVGCVVGGATSISGALYGALFIQFVPQIAEGVSRAAPSAVFGVLLILTVFLAPRGVAGLVASLRVPQFVPRWLAPAATLGVLALFILGAAQGGATSRLHGVSDDEIRIGQTVPYSGAASNIGILGHASVAYFAKVNAAGGVNGRRIRLISLDDGYSPPRTVEQTRKLVEREDVLLMFNSAGTATQLAVHRYLNAKQVPQLFVTSGAGVWANPADYPWTMPSALLYDTEARAFARYILRERPNARIAVLYQNDDFGRDYLRGFQEGLGAEADRLIIATRSYDATASSVDSEMIALAGSGADTFMDFATGKFLSQAIRRAYDIGWRPLQFIPYNSASIGATLVPAGLEKSVGLLTTAFQMNPLDPQWKDNPDMLEFLEWLKDDYPAGDVRDSYVANGYWRAALITEVLRRAGDDLSRENVMRQAASLHDVRIPMMVPGVVMNTGPNDYRPIEQYQFVRFDGQSWLPFGPLYGP